MYIQVVISDLMIDRRSLELQNATFTSEKEHSKLEL